MIKNEREKQRKLQEIKEMEKLIASNRELLKRVGLNDDDIQQHIKPSENTLAQMKAEVAEYETLSSGNVPEEEQPIERIGEFLVKLRIAKQMTQKDLANLLDVDETQVSRDEKNFYRGASLERLLKVIAKLGVQVEVKAHDMTSV